MTQQKNPVVFGGTEHNTAEKPSVFVAQNTAQQKTPVVFLWHRTWHSRKIQWFLVAKDMAQQKNPVDLCALNKDAVKG